MVLSFRLNTVTVKIPEDVLLEILARLPVDSVTRFKCVSKLWYSLISSRYFANLFVKFSSRRVFVYTKNYKLFSSSSRSNLVETASFSPINLDLTMPDLKNDRLEFVNSIRGLMCFRVGREIQRGIRREIKREIRIVNFTTRQVLSLTLRKPNMFLESDSSMRDYESMWNYFGYDPVNDEYKVLSIISSVSSRGVRSETQVLVLGAGASWRNTSTSPPPHHLPYGKGISINGVLYYGAWSHEEKCVLMSFDFNNEEFNVIEFPKEAQIKWNENGCFHKVNLMNYQDQVAILDGSLSLNSTECILVQNLWVLEDVGKSIWSRKFFGLPCHQLGRIFGTNNLGIRGTSRSGEVILSGRYDKHAIYDLERNRIIKGVVIDHSFYICPTTLWDDVESIMALEA